MTNPRRANGHRRDQLRARLLAASPRCDWPTCPWPTDQLGPNLVANIRAARPADYWLDERYPVIDELVPIAYGGSPVDPANTVLKHRWCNGQRGAGKAAPQPIAPVTASPGW